MKAFLKTTPSTKSSINMEEDSSETRESSYYPGCRKDANCKCEICLASINATLDLLPISIQKSSLTKFSASSRTNVERTPVPFDASIMSSPSSSTYRMSLETSPILNSTARMNIYDDKLEKRKRERSYGHSYCCGVGFLRLVAGLCFVCVVEIGFSWGVNGVLRPVFKPDLVRGVGERSWVINDINGRLQFLQRELQGLTVEGKVSNCSYANSIWKISQDGLLLNSRCTLYKSLVEEVSIWGWPLQTAGLLTTGFSSRSFTVVSGRVTEWYDGKVGYSIRKANDSWVHRKWGASVVQLDANTWVLEYKNSLLVENSRFFSTALEFLKHWLQKMAGRIKQEFWLFSAFENQFSESSAKDHTLIPT
ncbi:ERG2_Sigma1R domain-containing protein [Cephalotus follicularis]|uniref:ERG2_Sigma1R domain-containing protein n=1 Tax=Cephalotus follicularis TaxID=3775 RepID=A0A1Q3CP59_CEPFO|nr:ERG2_Sigma1R domain-containing protein [Cephalotus follicularis]